MSAYGMKPSFTDWNGYQKWLKEWSVIYQTLSENCRKRKNAIKDSKRADQGFRDKELFAKYKYDRAMATKMMTLRNEAVIRWKNIVAMNLGIKKQKDAFPITIEDARNIDFHFNKKHLEFPQIPMWSLKAKGVNYSIHHLDCRIPWSTKEKPDDKSTKGMIRIKRGNIYIDKEGSAVIS